MIDQAKTMTMIPTGPSPAEKQAKAREQFIERFKDQFQGCVSDAAIRARAGGELAIFLRTSFFKMETLLGKIFDELAPKEQPKDMPKSAAPAKPGVAGKVG